MRFSSFFIFGMIGWWVFLVVSFAVGQSVTDQTPGAQFAPLLASDNHFAFRLFTSLVREDQGKNIFLCPYSIVTALRMTYNGTRGETRKAMAESLGITQFSSPDLHNMHFALTERLLTLQTDDPELSLSLANALWAQEDIAFQAEFLRVSEEFYRAELHTVDFADPRALSLVNEWVCEKTQGKVEKILERLDPDTIMIIVNAVFLSAPWQRAFDPQATQELPFTLLDGTTRKHPMMYQRGAYLYWEDEELQAVALPYGATGRVNMYLFLPRLGVDFGAFLSSLSGTKWEEWMARFGEYQGVVMIPRFRLAYGVELKEVLRTLGMGIIFTPQADLSALTLQPAFVSEVVHRALVEVNERGTEAGGASAVVIAKGGPAQPFLFIADRPFFFVLRDDLTGVILFMGCVVDPQE